VLAAQASGAQLEFFWLTVYIYGDPMYIGQPAPIGMVLRMAHVVAKLRRFSTQITLQFLFSVDLHTNLLYNSVQNITQSINFGKEGGK
jgi:hypothetical protein